MSLSIWLLFGAGAAAAAAAVCFRSAYERKHFVITEYEVKSSKIGRAFDGYTFVAMTDLHQNEFGTGNERLLNAIDKIKPDSIVSGGDMVVAKGRPKTDIALSFMKKLAEKYPIYYGSGNHEQRMKSHPEIYGDAYEKYVEELKKSGVVFLQDCSVTIRRGTDSLTIAGVDLFDGNYPKFRKAGLEKGYLTDRLGIPGDGFYFLLVHSPLYFPDCAEWGADLVLSGHFHGGTVILPGLGGLMSPDFKLFPRYYRGRYDEYGTTMILSAGLGTHSVNLRLGNLPELIIIRLKSGEK